MCLGTKKKWNPCLTSSGGQGLQAEPSLPQTLICSIKAVSVMFVSPSERCLLDKERRQDFTFWRISNLPHSPAQPGAHLAPCWLAPGAILAVALCLCFKRQRGLPNGQQECVEGSACYRTSTCSALCGGGGGRVRCFPQFPSGCFTCLNEATKHYLRKSQQSVWSWVCI